MERYQLVVPITSRAPPRSAQMDCQSTTIEIAFRHLGDAMVRTIAQTKAMNSIAQHAALSNSGELNSRFDEDYDSCSLTF